VGTYSAKAAYPGDSNYNSVTSSADSFTVAKVTPTNVVTNSPTSPTVGQSVTFTATITGPSGGATPSGTVTWTLTGPVTSCASTTGPTTGSPSNIATYTCVITASAAGTYSANAAYPGDSNYNSVTSSPDSFTVAITAAGLVQVDYSTYTGSSTPKAISIPTTTAGDLIVVSVSQYTGSSAFTVSDNASPTSNTYTKTTENPTGSYYDGIAYVLSAKSVTSVTITTPGSSNNVAVTIAEFAGYTSVDGTPTGNTGVNTSSFSSGSVSTSHAPDLLVGMIGFNNSSFAITSTGYTTTTEQINSQANEQLAYQQVTSTGSYSFAGTLGVGYWGAVIYAFH
jgi:hypothetical protein